MSAAIIARIGPVDLPFEVLFLADFTRIALLHALLPLAQIEIDVRSKEL